MRDWLDHEHVAAFDERVDREFDRVRGHKVFDRFFYALTELANHSILWHTAGALIAICSPKHLKSSIRLSLALGVESALVNGPIKMFFRRTRPEVIDERPHKLRQPKTSSFPSGHATSAFFAAAIISESHPKLQKIVYPTAVLVASSRVYVKIHHASDIVAGAAIGASMGAVARRIFRQFR